MASDKNKKILTVRDNQLGWVLFTGYIGALVFFVQRNQGFWGDVLAFLQAAVWPGYVLHAVLKALQI